jgi:hypothetical protein
MEIIKGPVVMPPRVTVHGPAGVGKTTFACQAPAPIMIPVEDGAAQVGVDRVPLCRKSAAVFAALDGLLTESHPYETVIIDSIDWLERLLHEEHAASLGVVSIADVPYGRGYTAILPSWEKLRRTLDRLRDEKGMAVVLIAHTEVKHQEPPDSEPYDASVLKLHKGAAAIITEWSDVVGYASLESRVKETDAGFGRKITRGTTTGKRILRTHPNPAFTAKTRYALPDKIALTWGDFVDAFIAATAKAEVRASIEAIKGAAS